MKEIKEKKYLYGLVFAGTVVLIFFYFIISYSPDNQSGNMVTEIYFADNISDAHTVVIDNFNRKYEGKIKIIPIDLPFSKFSTNERKELIARSLRSKSESIDVFAVDLIWVPRFAKWSEPLNNYFKQNELSAFLPYALESCMIDTLLAAVPMYLDISMMFVREDMLMEMPDYENILDKLKNSMTWDEFIELGQKFIGTDNPYYLFPAADYEGLICSYFELILSLDKDFFGREEISFDNHAGLTSLNLLSSLINKHKLTPPVVTEFKERNCYQYFLENDGIFLRGWPSFEKDSKNLLQDPSKKYKIKKAALPHFGNEPLSVYGGWNLMVSKFTEHKREAVEFIKYFTSDEAQRIMFELGGYLPVTKELYQDSTLNAVNGDLQYLKTLLDRGAHRPFLEDYTRISDIVSYYVNKTLKKEIEPQEALRNIDEMIRNNKVIIK